VVTCPAPPIRPTLAAFSLKPGNSCRRSKIVDDNPRTAGQGITSRVHVH
jgi:hypothetical protein